MFEIKICVKFEKKIKTSFYFFSPRCGPEITCVCFCINFDCTKIGYKCQVLCEFMQGSFVVVLDLLSLVPTYFLLVGFINAEF